MANQISEISVRGIDTKALASLIIDLNIARRNCRSYPKGHPLIDFSLQKVLGIYETLMLTEEEIIVGVTRDALMVEDVFLDKSNLVYRDFAGILFERGVGALVLNRGLTIAELRSFAFVLNMKRDDIYQQGGIEIVWEKSNINALRVWPIRFDLFSTTEGVSADNEVSPLSAEGLWERFVRGLTRGTLNPDGSSENVLDPGLLASVVNHQFILSGDKGSNYAQNIIDHMRQDDVFQSAGNHAMALPTEKLATFVSNMNPALRSQFLNSAFDMKTVGNQTIAENIFNHLSSDTILETLEEVNRSHIMIPPIVMELLQRLSKHSTAGQYAIESNISDNDDLHQKMRTIFREHISENFVPDDYQHKLNQMVTAEHIPILGNEDVCELMDTLDASSIECRICDILLFLIVEDPTVENINAQIESINDICDYFLKTGDYEQVLKIMHQVKNEPIPDEIRQDLLYHYAQQPFLEEVMSGLRTWGKVRFQEIGQIIGEVGDPFIGILLDQLAEEESISLRRFMMERLQEFGSAARNAVSVRLSDSRWYFLRNLIVLIRSMNDRSFLNKLRPLLNDSNQRVRQEVLKTLLHFNDSGSERQILRDMDSNEHEVIMTAIRLAEKSTSPEIFNKLLSIVNKSGLSTTDYEQKSAAVQILAETGNVNTLPHLLKIINSHNVLHPTLLLRLKLDVIRSLERYPSHHTSPILERLSSGRDEIAQQAAFSLMNVSG